MHPPYFIVDHKIGTDIRHHDGGKYMPRHRLPDRLTLMPSATGWPPIPLNTAAFTDNSALYLPSGAMLPVQAMLRVIPSPRWGWQDAVGRLLIRVGQRMIVENRV